MTWCSSNSRGTETLRDLVADIGPRAQAATVRDAAASGELVVVTIPFKAHKTCLSSRWLAKSCWTPGDRPGPRWPDGVAR